MEEHRIWYKIYIRRQCIGKPPYTHAMELRKFLSLHLSLGLRELLRFEYVVDMQLQVWQLISI